jgi:hypothetical protein
MLPCYKPKTGNQIGCEEWAEEINTAQFLIQRTLRLEVLKFSHPQILCTSFLSSPLEEESSEE